MEYRNASYSIICCCLTVLCLSTGSIGRVCAQEFDLALPAFTPAPPDVASEDAVLLDAPLDVGSLDDSPPLPLEPAPIEAELSVDGEVSRPKHISLGQPVALEAELWQKYEMELVSELAGKRARAAMRLSKLERTAIPALDSLYERLGDVDSEVRMSAAHAIGNIGGEVVTSVEQLVPSLNDSDEHVRYAAEWSIAKLCVQPIPVPEVERLLAALKSSVAIMVERAHHAGHRSVIEQAIAQLQSQTLDNGLQPSIVNTEPEEPSVAVLAPLPPPLPTDTQSSTLRPIDVESDPRQSEVRGLPEQFEIGDIATQLMIIDRIAEIDDLDLRGAVFDARAEILQSMILSQQKATTAFAMHRWGQSGQIAVMQLFEKIPVSRLPVWTGDLLGQVEPRNLADVNKLLRIVNEPNQDSVRTAAAKALARWPQPEPAALRLFAAAREATHSETVRVSFLSAMTDLIERSETTLAPELEISLLDMLREARTPWELRLQVGSTLARLLPSSREAAQAFAQATARHRLMDHEVGKALQVQAAFQYTPPSARTLVERGLHIDDDTARVAACELIQKMAKRDKSRLSDLRAVMLQFHARPETSSEVLAASVKVLAEMGPSALQDLADQLLVAKETSRIQSLEALATLETRALPCFDTCVAIVSDVEASTASKAAAALTIGAMGPRARAAAPALTNLLHQYVNTPAESAALIALVRIGEARNPSLWSVHSSQHPAWLAAATLTRCELGDSQAIADLVFLLEHPTNYPFAADAILDIGVAAKPYLERQIHVPQASVSLRTRAMDVLLQLPGRPHASVLDAVGDSVVGDASAERLAGLPSNQDVSLLADVVGLLRESRDPVVHDRLMNIIESQLVPARQETQVSIGFDSYLAADLMQQLKVELPAEPTPGHASGTAEKFVKDASVVSPQEVNEVPTPVIGNRPEPEAPARLTSTIPMPQREQEEVDVASEDRPTVNVYYGTNRAHTDLVSSWNCADTYQKLFAIVIALGIIGVWVTSYLQRRTVVYATVGMMVLVAVLAAFGITNLRVMNPNYRSAGDEYSGEYSDELKLGVCQVSVPEHRKSVESEVADLSVTSFEFQRDPTKRVFLANVDELEPPQFFTQLNQDLEVKGKQLLVFIHGYNVTFEDAARRSAQLAHDLKFPGAPVFYSWPSRGNWYKYRLDRKNVELSVGHIKQFLIDLADKTDATSIHLVAHSMGNVGLTQALAEIENTETGPRFNQVVLAAPDIDADIFRSRVAPKIVTKAERCTVYTSKDDLALVASRYFNAGSRVGETLPQEPYDGVDFVDASEVDTSLLGHSYYGNASLLLELSEVLSGEPLDVRSYVDQTFVDGHIAWFVDNPFVERGVVSSDSVAKRRRKLEKTMR